MTTTLTLHITTKKRSSDFVLGSGPTRLGRDSRCEISIPDPFISREQLTITPQGDGALVEMNPQSRNCLIHDGRQLLRCKLLPGQSFAVGPYRFELLATVTLPDMPYHGLPPDPAGQLTDGLGHEGQRAAPRWRAESSSRTARPDGGEQKASSAGLVAALSLVLLILGGSLIYDTLRRPKATEAPPASEFTPPDVLAAIRILECEDASSCERRAEELYKTARLLSQSGSRDLLTLYKIAKQDYRALHLLSRHKQALPGLDAHYDGAQAELVSAFSDLWFRYRRAVLSDDHRLELAALRSLYPLCEEDPHAFCRGVKLAYRRLQDELPTN